MMISTKLTDDQLSGLAWAWMGAGMLIVVITTAFPVLINDYWVEPDLALCTGFSFLAVGIAAEITRMVTPWEE